MLEILKSIADSSDLFPHLKQAHYICEDCPEVSLTPATQEFKFTADPELSADTCYLCDHCTDNNNDLGMLNGYDNLGNPNK